MLRPVSSIFSSKNINKRIKELFSSYFKERLITFIIYLSIILKYTFTQITCHHKYWKFKYGHSIKFNLRNP